MSALDINDNNFLRQFEVEINGNLAKVEYALQERKIFLTKIIIPKVADDDFKVRFLTEIFEIIKEKNLRMMPTDIEIKKFIKSHREYMKLLPVGVRI
jgi:hypothetical protein